jgi:hypothetical protein
LQSSQVLPAVSAAPPCFCAQRDTAAVLHAGSFRGIPQDRGRLPWRTINGGLYGGIGEGMYGRQTNGEECSAPARRGSTSGSCPPPAGRSPPASHRSPRRTGGQGCALRQGTHGHSYAIARRFGITLQLRGRMRQLILRRQLIASSIRYPALMEQDGI